MNESEFARFMLHVEIGECWLWTLSFRKGYGQFCFRGTSKGTHRLMLERVLGRELKEGMFALHSCRNKHCCRPEHLREGTHQENMDDRTQDGKTPHKLTEDQVRAIRADARPHRVIAKEYGVSHSTIGDTIRRKRYTHI